VKKKAVKKSQAKLYQARGGMYRKRKPDLVDVVEKELERQRALEAGRVDRYTREVGR
jgi:hypothetical protein